MSFIAIGDIHGCSQTLDHLLRTLQPAAEDHLVFVGDYVDRGPDSKGVVERCLMLASLHQCTFLRGNHEGYVLDFLAGRIDPLWDVNGGAATRRSYLDSAGRIAVPDVHRRFFLETELYLETPNWVFVHAGLRPDRTVRDNLVECGSDVFLEERGHLRVNDAALKWEKTVVCGHTPTPQPINREKLIGIDTGCVWGAHRGFGRLTAVRLPEREFVSVKNRD